MALITRKSTVAKQTGEHIHSIDDGMDFVICKNPERLQLLLDKIQPGKSTFFISKGDWSMHDMIMPLLNKYQPAELFVTTYAIREFSIRQLLTAIENKWLTKVTMVLDHRASIRTAEVYHLARSNFAKIFLTAVHAKICVLKHPAGTLTVMASANWTSNPKIETGVVSMNESLGNWYIDHIKKISDGATIFD